MPQIGPLELVIILVLALIILGPGRLPDVGSALGKSIREFRKASSDIQEATRIDTSPLPAKATAVQDAPPPAVQTAPEAPAVPEAAAPAGDASGATNPDDASTPTA
ncbi:MAG: twin-arginine translocase TatA/TatE family subunit [Chloroflexota bacterium]